MCVATLWGMQQGLCPASHRAEPPSWVLFWRATAWSTCLGPVHTPMFYFTVWASTELPIDFSLESPNTPFPVRGPIKIGIERKKCAAETSQIPQVSFGWELRKCCEVPEDVEAWGYIPVAVFSWRRLEQGFLLQGAWRGDVLGSGSQLFGAGKWK